jgi:hypothetical protein
MWGRSTQKLRIIEEEQKLTQNPICLEDKANGGSKADQKDKNPNRDDSIGLSSVHKVVLCDGGQGGT